MRRVIYISPSLVGLDADALSGILSISAVRNDLSGITGLLWWSDEVFGQALEGTWNAVENTMARIRRDPRHAEIEIVEDREVSSRIFGSWSMAQADDSAAGIAATSFLTGFCAGRRTDGARRLYEFLLQHA